MIDKDKIFDKAGKVFESIYHRKPTSGELYPAAVGMLTAKLDLLMLWCEKEDNIDNIKKNIQELFGEFSI